MRFGIFSIASDTPNNNAKVIAADARGMRPTPTDRAFSCRSVELSSSQALSNKFGLIMAREG
jgi:hypothetical protein